MKYTTPELIVIGEASKLVLGGKIGVLDSSNPDVQQPADDVALGLDD